MDVAAKLAKLIEQSPDGRTRLSHLLSSDTVLKWGDGWQNQERGPDGKFGSGGGSSSSDTAGSSSRAPDTSKATNDKRLADLAAGKPVTVMPSEVKSLFAQAGKEENQQLKTNAEDLHVEGMKVFDQQNLGYSRESMPQIPSES